ncbi:MAG: hypothetical protein ACKOFD_01240, partial [Actinomycetota bacterium]
MHSVVVTHDENARLASPAPMDMRPCNREAEQRNIVVRFDHVAEGNPLEWTVSRVRNRLPHMLEHAGAQHLADLVRASSRDVAVGIDELAALLARAAVDSGH